VRDSRGHRRARGPTSRAIATKPTQTARERAHGTRRDAGTRRRTTPTGGKRTNPTGGRRTARTIRTLELGPGTVGNKAGCGRTGKTKIAYHKPVRQTSGATERPRRAGGGATGRRLAQHGSATAGHASRPKNP